MRKCLILVVALNAGQTIETVIRRIPGSLAERYDVEVLIIDDSSKDETFEKSFALTQGAVPFKVNILSNRVNLGYGGNQKLGYHFAIEQGFDFVVLLHGDGKYAPESLPQLLAPLDNGEADAVFGSRMLKRGAALRGGMPLYKFAGNKLLTWAQNHILGTNLSEFHCGYRAYSTIALRSIPFEYNSNDFDFDTQLTIQLQLTHRRIVEQPVPTYYGEEISHVNGLKYAFKIMQATVRARLQELSLFYDSKYDCSSGPLTQYTSKLDFESTHSFALNAVESGSRVLDLGCAGGYICSVLNQNKACRMTGVDAVMTADPRYLDRFYEADLNNGLGSIPVEDYDFVLLLDVIEHLSRPEAFLEELRRKMSMNPSAELIISTGNVAFIVTRFMLLAGCFNYGKRGILDLTHTRLFTAASLKRLLEQSGFVVSQSQMLPAPFPLAVGGDALGRFLLKLNSLLIRLSGSLFGYQMIMRAKANPTLEWLLQDAHAGSIERKAGILANADR